MYIISPHRPPQHRCAPGAHAVLPGSGALKWWVTTGRRSTASPILTSVLAAQDHLRRRCVAGAADRAETPVCDCHPGAERLLLRWQRGLVRTV